MTEPVAHLSSKSKYCQECGFPEQEKVTDGDLDDAMDEHANLAMDNGFVACILIITAKRKYTCGSCYIGFFST